MRILDSTRFPHPVLGQQSSDFASGEFDVHFQALETPRTGRLQLQHKIMLTEPAVYELVFSQRAAVGCIVRCEDTYHTELRRLSWPTGYSDFTPGSLLNRVTLRPIVWLETGLKAWNPGGIHKEFAPPVNLVRASVIAVGPEYVLSVGHAKFQPLESIFELRRASDVPEGRIGIDPAGDRIGIIVPPLTYEAIGLLRGQAWGQPILMNAVYLPAVMDVLDYLRAGTAQFEGCRWLNPFMARCDALGIDVTARASILETAQTLLNNPAHALAEIARQGDA
jgi:hypothetical protein